jgi:hypothetical protein
MIALYRALGARFDDDMALAGVVVGYIENALGPEILKLPEFKNLDELKAQQLRAAVESKQAFPHTLVAKGFNNGRPADTKLISDTFARGHGFAFAHPDTVPGVYYGIDGLATKYEIQYSGIVPTFAKAEQTFINQDPPGRFRDPDITSKQWDWGMIHIGSSFFAWGNASSRVPNYLNKLVIPFMRTNPTMTTKGLACPTTAAPCISDDGTLSRPICSDGKDNDGDGKTDYPADPGCAAANDSEEYNAPVRKLSR